MADDVRVQVRLDRRQYERLKELARKRGESVASLIRLLLDRSLGPPLRLERRRVTRRLKDFLYGAAPESLHLHYRVVVERDGVGVFEADLPSMPGLPLPGRAPQEGLGRTPVDGERTIRGR